jgi:hypothetical protein
MTANNSGVYLDNALSRNPLLRKIVIETYPEEYLTILNELFQELYSNGCKGIETKFFETSPELFRFQATMAEMEFANFFIKNNCTVELLSNNAFQGRIAPDIRAICKGKEYFIEVKNIELDELEHNLGSKIAQHLNALKLSYVVVVKAATCLSTPAYRAEERRIKENICATIIQDFKKKIEGLKQESRIISIEMENADIELHPTKQDKSFLGISTMKEAITQPENYKQRIMYDIITKAKKRSNWKGKELDPLFIVALKDNSWLFGIDEYNVELFGSCHYFMPPLIPPKVKVDDKIAAALAKGWNEYLTKMCVINNGQSVIPENQRGMLFTEPVLSNVTAFLVENKKRHFLLANPFAEEKINSPEIIKCFEGVISGWE